MSKLVSVYTASNETDARILCSMLQGAGIEASMSTDDGGGMLPILQVSEGVEVLVDDERQAEAQEILAQYEKGQMALKPSDEAQLNDSAPPDLRPE